MNYYLQRGRKNFLIATPRWQVLAVGDETEKETLLARQELDRGSADEYGCDLDKNVCIFVYDLLHKSVPRRTYQSLNLQCSKELSTLPVVNVIA